MSASWDPDREGSLLGTDEFAQNVDNIKSGLSRSRENALLREKVDMSIYTQDEMDAFDINQKKSSSRPNKKSFTEKMEDEME